LREIVTFNFSPRNLTQVTSTMKPGQDSMFGFSSVKRITLREVILKIELEPNNLNSILSRSAVTPVFPIWEKLAFWLKVTSQNLIRWKVGLNLCTLLV